MNNGSQPNFWIDAFLHADKKIAWFVQHNGSLWAYALLFLILFAETGFVVTPFLPGDTLLFAAGILGHPEQHALNLAILLPLLTVAPLCGDCVNFLVGKWLGPRLFHNENSKIFKRKNLAKTHEFFEKYGRRTIILARWVPVVRTFAPFVAGMSQMDFRHFFSYSVVGAIIWVWICTLAGYWFGSLPVIQKNFGIAMVVMALITFIPLSIEITRQVMVERSRNKLAAKGTAAGE